SLDLFAVLRPTLGGVSTPECETGQAKPSFASVFVLRPTSRHLTVQAVRPTSQPGVFYQIGVEIQRVRSRCLVGIRGNEFAQCPPSVLGQPETKQGARSIEAGCSGRSPSSAGSQRVGIERSQVVPQISENVSPEQHGGR